MPHAALERLVTLVRRELAADDARVLPAGAVEPDAPNVLSARLPDGRLLVATFSAAPEDRPALLRRLEILAHTFAGLLDDPSPRARLAAPLSLHEELTALVRRARSRDALVIDVDSPVVWGSALRPRASAPTPALSHIPRPDASQQQLIDPDAGGDGPDLAAVDGEDLHPEGLAALHDASMRAADRARGVADRALLHKGKHLRHVEVTKEEGGIYVVSFLGIYLLVLVFEGAFDELRAERAVSESLPRIERLVLALPPHDPGPQPMGSVVSIRRRR